MALLEAEQVVMRFGGVVALDSASVDIDPGEVTGLIGPNGAGKTTLFNVVTGLLPPTSGKVRFDGVDITRAGVAKRSQMGIARTFQKLEAFNTLSAFDNVRVAVEKNHRGKWKHRRVSDVAHEMLGRVGLDDVADVTVGTLPTGSARLVELARALACRPRVLLLDEPSSGLNEEETTAIGQMLLELVGNEDNDLAVLLVEHDMSFVMGVCARIHVLDFGKIIAVGTPLEVQADSAVRAAYLGGDEFRGAYAGADE
ncbi:ABC transporter ATP-binding protein [Candidatus Poriferisocius sp.]|uniref:ABC transporter ATP-binding protein n=1 Tax=Candidatus Poriferisocius sp. TaxID=3101276 RepID=UPI003B021872